MTYDGAAISTLSHWVNFYVIIGSSAGALTGLQFVVMTLISEGKTEATIQGIRVFGTPTVVHFCAALVISAILTMPWHGLFSLALILGIFGATGVAYLLKIIWHAHHQTHYRPVVEDWIWYAALPVLAYSAMVWSAIELQSHTDTSLFVIAIITLALLFIGIHNSWDIVTYLAITKQKSIQKNKE